MPPYFDFWVIIQATQRDAMNLVIENTAKRRAASGAELEAKLMLTGKRGQQFLPSSP